MEDERKLVKEFLLTKSEHHFRRLYRQYTLPLYRLALQLSGGNNQAAEDIIQETWLRAVNHLHEFRWQSALKTWLSGIAINCCREYNRKQNISNVTIEELENQLQSVEQKIENKIDLQQALSFLPQGYREILVLHDVEGYKHKEIGELLGISEGTSKSQLFNARKAMKKLLM
jgi:RNA polymerase sigma-70 factor (ECF subfamily)